MAEFTVTVRRTEQRDGGVVFYGLAIHPPPVGGTVGAMTVFRRFNDFVVLDAALRNVYPGSPTLQYATLPPRYSPTALFSARTVVAAQRAPLLAHYLAALLSDAKLVSEPALRCDFLGLPAATAGQSVVRTDPASSDWPERLRSLRREIVECHRAADSRDTMLALGNTLNAINLSSKTLDKVASLVRDTESLDLDAGASDSKGHLEQTRPSAQEATRRRNLLLNCRQELALLKTRLSVAAVASSPLVKPTDFGPSASSARKLGPSRVASTTTTQNDRVTELAAPASLHSHKQIMVAQDAALDSLAETVSRQRAIGTMLGAELAEQNELLDDMKQDAHSSRRKVKSTLNTTKKFT